VKRLNGSSEVEIGRSISNAVEVSEWTVKLFSGINVKTQKTFTSKSCYRLRYLFGSISGRVS